MAKEKKQAPKEWMYEVIRKPHVTEKSTLGSQYGQVTFQVPLSADKSGIKSAVEALFDVKVKKVNTLITKGKSKRFKGVIGRRSDFKKAIVTLEEGHTIETGEGI